jgi:hypothetical protein
VKNNIITTLFIAVNLANISDAVVTAIAISLGFVEKNALFLGLLSINYYYAFFIKIFAVLGFTCMLAWVAVLGGVRGPWASICHTCGTSGTASRKRRKIKMTNKPWNRKLGNAVMLMLLIIFLCATLSNIMLLLKQV